MSARKVAKFLIVRANGDARVISKRPRLRFDEVAWKLEVTIPDMWGRIQAEIIALEMPEPDAAALRAVADPT